MLSKPIIVGLLASLACGRVLAQDGGFKLEPLHVYGSWEAGELVDYETQAPSNQPQPNLVNASGSNVGSELIDHSAVWILQEAQLTDNVKVFLGVGGTYFFTLPQDGQNNNSFSVGQKSAFGLTDAHGEFEFWRQGESDHGLLLKAGVFPFKYDEDAKNLGEYMFRTYAYPTLITTGGLMFVNSAAVQLNGLDANTQYGGFKNDLLLTDNTDQVPTGSLSLTDIVSYTYKNFLTAGGGFMFANFYNPDKVAEGISGGDYANNGAEYYIQNGDTLHYSFVGQKVMVKAALDLGRLVSSPMLSDKDLTLYFEAILMGLDDYPGYYDSMKNRIAFMYGLNLPTFRLLDLLSVEFEYCRNPYGDNLSNVQNEYAPIPVTSTLGGGDNVKWTVYARKNIVRGFSVSVQAARDHTRLVDFFGKTDDESVMELPQNWYWALQLSYSI